MNKWAQNYHMDQHGRVEGAKGVAERRPQGEGGGSGSAACRTFMTMATVSLFPENKGSLGLVLKRGIIRADFSFYKMIAGS